MRRIKIAQIGLNAHSHSTVIFQGLLRQPDSFDVVGYVLPEDERTRLPEKLGVLGGYRELSLDEVLNDPEIEAVAVETDEVCLTRYALLAAKAGKHIHMEKPGGTELGDFEALIQAVKRSGKVFHTGYMYRYNPCVAELLQSVKNGELGEILSVEAQMSLFRPGDRRWLEDFPGGMMFHLGCHLVDLLLQIQGKPQRIIPFNRCSGTAGCAAKDFSMAVFDYGNAVSFVKTTLCEIGGYARRQLVVSGTKGTAELKPLEMRGAAGGDFRFTEKTLYTSPKLYDRGTFTRTADCDRYAAMLRGFARYVAGETENPWTPDYELELYRTLLQCCGAEERS